MGIVLACFIWFVAFGLMLPSIRLFIWCIKSKKKPEKLGWSIFQLIVAFAVAYGGFVVSRLDL